MQSRNGSTVGLMGAGAEAVFPEGQDRGAGGL